MNKYEIYNQKVENNSNLKIIKSNTKTMAELLWVTILVNFCNVVMSIISMVHIVELYNLINKILEKY